jgi:biopolymer transport protein ExbB
MDLMHVFKEGDSVLITVFLLLIAMSAASWAIIIFKIIAIRAEQKSIALYGQTGAATGNTNLLLDANKLAPAALNLTQALDNIKVKLDSGLTTLASIGSSAPFIGLFGTVWGIYGALTKIAAAGNASLNVVAGPMGEALVATAIGLFAAIPAVLAYNAFVRYNRVLAQNFRHIAEQLEAGSKK